jgi:uncharacterized caspase-like protein
MKKILAFFAITLLLFGGCTQPPDKPLAGNLDTPQIALVIGNASYKQDSLQSPINDAAAMAKVLREMDFYVIEGSDLSHQDMNNKIVEFTNVLKQYSKNGGIALFYFSGHGTGIDEKNYVVPIDAELDSSKPKEEITKNTISTKSISEQMIASNSHGANFMILDSCRNDPFTLGKGYGQNTFIPKPIKGTLTAYSAGKGQLAKDGTRQGYSLYTKHLLGVLHHHHVKNKPVQIRDVLKSVRNKVYADSKRTQNPQVQKGDDSGAVERICLGFQECKPRTVPVPRLFPRST